MTSAIDARGDAVWRSSRAGTRAGALKMTASCSAAAALLKRSAAAASPTIAESGRHTASGRSSSLERILGDLLEEGYRGVFDLELLGPRIESEGARAATKRAAENLSGILAKLGA